jgi:hypothetical protein
MDFKLGEALSFSQMKLENDCFYSHYACISGAFGCVYPIDTFLSYTLA